MPKCANAAASVGDGWVPDVKTILVGEGDEPLAADPLRSPTRRAIAGAGSMNVTGHGRERGEPLEQERVVRAREYDGVGAAPAFIDEARLDLLRDQGVGDRSAVQLRLGIGREVGRADERDVAAVGKVADQCAVYSRLTVAWVPSTVTRLVTELAQAGLIAGTVPTKGTRKRWRRCGSTSVEAVLQAITMRSGACAVISSPINATTRATSSGSLRPL
jgi:hypothetical protein